MNAVSPENLHELLKKELPQLLRQDEELREIVRAIMQKDFAGKQQTQDRFDEALAELRREREAETRRWEELRQDRDRKWAEQVRRWDEQSQQWRALQQDQNEKWAEQVKKWDEQSQQWQALQQDRDKKWAEQVRKWDEQSQRWQALQQDREEKRKALQEDRDKKWEAHRKEFDLAHREIMALANKHDSTIGALGARWGLRTEESFRSALAGILSDKFGVKVVHVNDFDDSGEVFGRPDQVELDLVVRNGSLLIGEIKSNMDRGAMYLFERKARFYERRHQRQAERLFVISPMVDPRARKLAEELNIDVYSYVQDIEEL